VCAIISNIIITVSAGLITEESSFVYTKKIQAMFDIFMGIMMGAFVVSMAVPKIDSGRALLGYMAEHFPNAYFLYCLVMGVGLAAVFITPVHVVVQTDGSYNFVFPEWFLFALFMVVLAVIIFIPVKMRTYLKKAKPHKHIVQEAYLITTAVIGYTLGEMFFEIILPSLSIDMRSVGFVIQISLVGMIAYAIRDKTFLQDLLIPVTEADLKTKKTYDLPGGYSYLVEEETPSHCFEVFKDLVTHGNQGLCITRTMPDKVRSQYGLEKTPILWLTRVADSPDTLRPYPVGKISETVQLFISAGKKTVVLLDGVEYLILHNDFKTVLTSLQDLNEYIAQHDSILILPVDSEAMEPKQFALLRRDLRMIEKPPKIRQPELVEEPSRQEEETDILEIVDEREKAEVSEGGGFKQGLMLLICLGLAFSMFATSASVVVARVSEPHYAEGDSWTYSAEMIEQSTIEMTGTVGMEIMGLSTTTVGSSSYSTVENAVSGEGTFSGTLLAMPVEGDWLMSGTEFWDVQSNERISAVITSDMDGTVNTGMGLANMTISSTVTTETEIISDGWQHPIDVGQTGTVQVNLSYNLTVLIDIEGMAPMAIYDDIQTPSVVNYECTEKTTITVEAGTYVVYAVEMTNADGSKEINFHLPDAGAGAWIERYDSTGKKIGDYTLKSFSYRGTDEPAATYMGLPLEYWILIAVAGTTIAILSVAWFLMRRKEKE
jgi:hypothetical protein